MKQIMKNKYEILKEIGSGATGCVYLARDLHVNRPVAIKRMERLSEIRKEMELLKELKHQGLPEVYDYFEEDGLGYLIMEYVDGMTLKKYLEQNGVPETEQALQWMKELADILSYLHEKHPPIVYRDLKPANIMLMEDGTLRLIDLGGAFLRSHDGNEDRISIGTPGYSAPEQWNGIHVDARCDVYSFGAVFHELLTGVSPLKPPYERRPVRQYDRAFPVWLERLICQCTKENPKERYANMTQVKAELADSRKKRNGRRIWWRTKELVFGGFLVMAVIATLFPLLKGIPAECFPDPFLKKPVLYFSLLLFLYIALFGRRKNADYLIRQEKEVWLTEKRGRGLLALLALAVGLTGGALLFRAPISSQAAENTKSLWIDLKDEENRLLLLKEGAVLPVTERLCMEIPVDRLPKEELSFRVIATDQAGEVYSSRSFRIHNE